MPEVRVVVYIDATGRSAFTRWFEELNPEAAAKVSAALYRMGQGNFSNVEGAWIANRRANGTDSRLQGNGSCARAA